MRVMNSGSLHEILRFVLVGGMATLVHFTVLSLAVERGDLDPALANGAAFLSAVGVTFLGQSLWVFRGHGRLSLPKILRFAISLAAGFATNVTIMAVATRILNLDYRVGFLAGLVVATGLGFVLNKFWVFGRISS